MAYIGAFLFSIASLLPSVTALALDVGSNVNTVTSTENEFKLTVIGDTVALEPPTGSQISTTTTPLNTTAQALGLETRQGGTCNVCILRFYEAGSPGNLDTPCDDEDTSRPGFSRCVGNSVGCVDVNSSGGPLQHGFNSLKVGVCSCDIFLYAYGCSEGPTSRIPRNGPANNCYSNFLFGTNYGYAIVC